MRVRGDRNVRELGVFAIVRLDAGRPRLVAIRVRTV